MAAKATASSSHPSTFSVLNAHTARARGQIDSQMDDGRGILSHVAAAEVGYQAATFDERELNEEEHLEWGAVFALGERARRRDDS